MSKRRGLDSSQRSLDAVWGKAAAAPSTPKGPRRSPPVQVLVTPPPSARAVSSDSEFVDSPILTSYARRRILSGETEAGTSAPTPAREPPTPASTSSVGAPCTSSSPLTVSDVDLHDTNQPSTSSTSRASGRLSGTEPGSIDIGSFYDSSREDRRHMTTEDRKQIVQNLYKPPEDYKFPPPPKPGKGTIHHKHFRQFKWLAWSDLEKGCFCLPCFLFTGELTGRGGGQLSLVKKPLKRFTRLTGDTDGALTVHQKRDYHIDAEIVLVDFRDKVLENPNRDIQSAINRRQEEKVEQNRVRLLSIFKTVEFCGRNNIPLRGHRDFGELDLDATSTPQEGNFRQLLRFRIDAGDVKLGDFLDAAGRNATYISKTVQNKVISLAGQQILRKICERVKKTKYFSVIADETPDCAGFEQLTVLVRYIYEGAICEDFIAFVTVENQSAETLAATILETLKACGLDCRFLVGQGYDGAANMSGKYGGVQNLIARECKTAIYTHCAAHLLNLVLVKSSQLSSVRDTFETIRAVETFINHSTRRSAMFRDCVSSLGNATESRRTRLASLSQTRWAARHDACESFMQLYGPIALVLDTVSKHSDHPTHVQQRARDLFRAVTSPEFMITLTILSDVLTLTYRLSANLQTEALDLVEMAELVAHTRAQLQERLDGAYDPDECPAKRLFLEEAENLASVCSVELALPVRVRGRNAPETNETVGGYYLRKTYVPFLEAVIEQIDVRFGDHWRRVESFRALMPAFAVKFDSSDAIFASLRDTIEFYNEFLPDYSLLKLRSELNSWRRRFQMWEQSALPSTIMGALRECPQSSYPQIFELLSIFAVLPVTTASAERIFSSMKLLKSYMRSTMGEDRLVGLTLLYVHRDIELDYDDLVNEFARLHNRRLILEVE